MIRIISTGIGIIRWSAAGTAHRGSLRDLLAFNTEGTVGIEIDEDNFNVNVFPSPTIEDRGDYEKHYEFRIYCQCGSGEWEGFETFKDAVVGVYERVLAARAKKLAREILK